MKASVSLPLDSQAELESHTVDCLMTEMFLRERQGRPSKASTDITVPEDSADRFDTASL